MAAAENIPGAAEAKRLVDYGAQMPPHQATGELASGDRLRETLAVGTDWARVIELYLDQEAVDGDGGARTPISALPNVARYLGADTRNLDDPDTHDVSGFYDYLESSGLLLDPGSTEYAENVAARENAKLQQPVSAAAHADAHQAQNSRVKQYLGPHRQDLSKLFLADSRIGSRLSRLEELASLVAPDTGSVDGVTFKNIRQPVPPELAPLDAQLTKSLKHYANMRFTEMHKDAQYSELPAARVEGDLSLLEKVGIGVEDFQRLVDVAVHSYPSKLMAPNTTFRLKVWRAQDHGRGAPSMGIASIENDGASAVIDVFIDEIISEVNKSEPEDHRSKGTRLLAKIEEVLDHELDHVVHNNAPIDWLREWDEMLRHVSLAGISPYTESLENPIVSHGRDEDERAKRREQISEAAQLYRQDPISLINKANSVEPVRLLQKLLSFYSDDVIDRLSNLHLPLDQEKTDKLRRDLAEDRQEVLASKLRASGLA